MEVRCIKNNNGIRFDIPPGTKDVKEYAKMKLKQLGLNLKGWKINFKK